MQIIYNELIKKIPKENILQYEPMSKHTTLKIGGLADLFIKIKNIEELKYVLQIAKKENVEVAVIGNGSNLLVKDKGIRGIVIKLEMNKIEVEDNEIVVEAGAMLSKVCKTAESESLSGLEFAYGIPGTIGGAITMNAGAYGGEMKDIVYSTTFIDENLKIKTINNKEHNFQYRKSKFSKEKSIILSTTLILKKGQKEEIQKRMEKNNIERRKKQPINYPNAGSTFKRGEDFITAKLIEEANLKGYTIGDAMISTVHSGFIVNKGNATAEDVLQLIEYIKKKIKEKFNKDLELEIKIIGE